MRAGQARPPKSRKARNTTRGLQAELKQKAPFTSREQEAYLALLRTTDALQSRTELKMKEFGLTGTQYNALRILRGAGPEGLPCSEIGERMITRDPDITRLLNRLEQRGLVERTRDHQDRRVVYGTITAAGKKLLREMDEPMEQHGRELLRHVSHADLQRLIALLEKVRGGGNRVHGHPERSRMMRLAHRSAESKDPYS
jgi:MarR family transcriptional regulator, organic hydroperoxide resistance regulator